MKSSFNYLLQLVGILSLVCVCVVAQTSVNSRRAGYTPKDGYVPDEQTAITIAVAVWTPIYGKEQIDNEKPYRAVLKDGVWTVTGALPTGSNGGTAIAKISKKDGRILKVNHEQ